MTQIDWSQLKRTQSRLKPARIIQAQQNQQKLTQRKSVLLRLVGYPWFKMIDDSVVEWDTPPFHWYGDQLDFDQCNFEIFIMAVWFCACASVNLALQGVATTQICWQTVGTWDDFCLKWMKLSSRRFAQGQDITALLQNTYTSVDLMLTHTFGLICCWWLTIHD